MAKVDGGGEEGAGGRRVTAGGRTLRPRAKALKADVRLQLKWSGVGCERAGGRTLHQGHPKAATGKQTKTLAELMSATSLLKLGSMDKGKSS